MSAEVVVIIENEHAGFRAGLFAIKVSGCQTADAAAHDNQVVSLPCVGGTSGGFPESSIAQGVSHVKGARLTASHTRQSRRVESCGMTAAPNPLHA